MKRRDLLGAGAAMAIAAALRAAPAATVAPNWARPGMPGWPGADEWAALNRAVGGRLSPVTLPDFADPAVRELLADPFYIGAQAGLTQSTGWLDAWRSVPSTYVVAAKLRPTSPRQSISPAPIACALSSRAAGTAFSAVPPHPIRC
jgi:hypothetical protein